MNTGGTRTPWNPTCVLCGMLGHVSQDCVNPPLPIAEQNRLREQDLRPLVPPARPATAGTPVYRPPGRTANTTPTMAGAAVVEELSPDDLGLQNRLTDPPGIMGLSVNMIEEWKYGPHDTLTICSETGGDLAQIIAGMTEVERANLMNRAALIAAAEKRALSDPDAIAHRTSARKFREPGDDDPTPPAFENSAPENPPVEPQEKPEPPKPERVILQPSGKKGSSPNNSSTTTATGGTPQWVPFVPDPYFTTPEALRKFGLGAPGFTPTTTKSKKPRKKKGEPVAKKVIRLIKGQTAWDPMESFQIPPFKV